jgi:hypothetical protein
VNGSCSAAWSSAHADSPPQLGADEVDAVGAVGGASSEEADEAPGVGCPVAVDGTKFGRW